MNTIAVLSHKGGVGKTLTCANLAASPTWEHAILMSIRPTADLSASRALDDDARPRIEDSLEHTDADVNDALEHPL